MSSSAPQGFTLLELTIALALSGGVMAMAASGLVALMTKDRQAAADRTHRYELQRTLDFMGNEIRMAAKISPCPNQDGSHYQPATASRNAHPILVLWMPTAMGLPEPIVYYLATPPRQSVWTGPQVLYRWGPTLRLNGDYSNNLGTYNYYNEVVVDQITSEIAPTPCPDSHPLNIGGSGLGLCLSAEQRSAHLTLRRQGHHRPITTTAKFSLRSREIAEQNTCSSS
jgi:prepilin-type N-terminal cleavage/methylation domain-containing protein